MSMVKKVDYLPFIFNTTFSPQLIYLFNWICWLKVCLYCSRPIYPIHYFGACLMNIELIGPKATEITMFAYSFPCFV